MRHLHQVIQTQLSGAIMNQLTLGEGELSIMDRHGSTVHLLVKPIFNNMAVFL